MSKHVKILIFTYQIKYFFKIAGIYLFLGSIVNFLVGIGVQPVNDMNGSIMKSKS